MKTIALTNSNLVTRVDNDMHVWLLSIGPWRLHMGYVILCGHYHEGSAMHNIVADFAGMDRTHGLTVDHRDRDPLNNRSANLRPATSRAQKLNQERRQDNSSGYIGVSPHRDKWQANISLNGKLKFLGRFTDKIDAARARDAAILAGPDAEFAVLNFPH